MKDNFSTQAKEYAKFRPTYPAALVSHIISLTKHQNTAWDCATGNGQIAALLSPYFNEIYASDISEKQLQNAVQKSNIFYKKEAAEKTAFPDDFFDLIIVAQAVHWFDFQVFYEEVKRVAKPGGILAILGYSLFKTDPDIEEIIKHFYDNIIGEYWDKERRYLDEAYQTISFPFEELNLPKYEMKYVWSLEEILGYLNTWSAVQHFIKANEENPLDLIEIDLRKSWGEHSKINVRFPVLTRVARIF